MLFFIHFHPFIPDMGKAGRKSRFPSNLPVPLIAERIDLIRKLSKIFIRHALTFFNNGNETFSCYHQAVKRAGFCTVNTLCLFFSTSCLLPCAICSPVSRSYASPLYGAKASNPTSFFDMFRKLYRGGFLAMYNKHFLRRLLKVCNPCSQMIPVACPLIPGRFTMLALTSISSPKSFTFLTPFNRE